MSDELKKLSEQVHDGVTTFDFEGKDVPCIILEERKYDEIISKVAGKSLAKTSMIALSSPKSTYGKDNVFMIQLPKPEKAENALEIIRRGLEQNNQK